MNMLWPTSRDREPGKLGIWDLGGYRLWFRTSPLITQKAKDERARVGLGGASHPGLSRPHHIYKPPSEANDTATDSNEAASIPAPDRRSKGIR
jgi:hypothetical protein